MKMLRLAQRPELMAWATHAEPEARGHTFITSVKKLDPLQIKKLSQVCTELVVRATKNYFDKKQQELRKFKNRRCLE
jgi:ribosomal protein L14